MFVTTADNKRCGDKNDQCITGSLWQLPTCMSLFAFLVYILLHPSNTDMEGLYSLPVPFPRAAKAPDKPLALSGVSPTRHNQLL